MRICYLGNVNSVHFRKMASSLARMGHDIHIVSFQVPKNAIEGAKTHIIDQRIHTILSVFPFFGEKLWFSMLKVFINIIRPDLVHAHYLTDYGDVGEKVGVGPFVVSVYGSDILLDARNDGNAIERRVLEKADLVICDGQNAMKKIAEMNVDMKKVRLIFIGVDVDRFKSKDVSHRLGNSSGRRFTVVSTRKLFRIYDVDMLISSIPMIVNEWNRIRFIIIGDGPERERLVNLVKENEIEEYVEFWGSIDNDDMPEVLAKADIYVSTSRSDSGLAVSTAEAMSCEMPVIVTDNSDNRLWIKDFRNGFVIQSGSPIQLAEKVLFLVKNPSLILEYGKNNRELIVAGFSMMSEMEKIEAEYRNCLLRLGI